MQNLWCRAAAAALIGAGLSGCAHLESIYRPVATVALQGPPAAAPDARCDKPADPNAPPYTLVYLKDCTASDSLIVFAFSGGGIRSASFGYGVLGAAHAVKMPDASGTGTHPLDHDIDIVSGVSGGSFTAAAFAGKRDALFPAPGAPDYYRDNFLTHDFMSDLLSIYVEPWHWEWMLPGYGSNDEMAKIYAGVDFSSRSDKLFDRNFGDLARKGRPLLVVQATDYGNEQPFTFTQDDFDLICSDVNAYPVSNAIAASSAFPILFSPIQLENHHGGVKPGSYCATHRPAWVDAVLDAPEPADLSRVYARARYADGYLPPRPVPAQSSTARPNTPPPAHVFLQDGGVSDNVALRGLTNIVLPRLDNADSDKPDWARPAAEAACRIGMDRVRRILVVAVDGEAQANNQVGSLPYLADLGLILDITSSAAIDANGFETMLATDTLTRKIAAKLGALNCDGGDAAPHAVAPYFARISFQDLDERTSLDPSACGRNKNEPCTLGNVARSGTSLAFSRPEVDALMRAGRSAFLCNRKVRQFLDDARAERDAHADLACRYPPEERKPD